MNKLSCRLILNIDVLPAPSFFFIADTLKLLEEPIVEDVDQFFCSLDLKPVPLLVVNVVIGAPVALA